MFIPEKARNTEFSWLDGDRDQGMFCPDRGQDNPGLPPPFRSEGLAGLFGAGFVADFSTSPVEEQADDGICLSDVVAAKPPWQFFER